MTNAFRSLSQTIAFGANADEFIKNYPHQNQTLNPIQLHRVIKLSLTKEADDITEIYPHGLCAAYCEATLDNLSDECHGKLTVLYAGGIPVHFLANVTYNNKTVFIDAYGAYDNISEIVKRYQDTVIDQMITVEYHGEDDNQQIQELREATLHLIDEFDIEGESEVHDVHYTEFYDDFLSTLFAHNIATIVAEHDCKSYQLENIATQCIQDIKAKYPQAYLADKYTLCAGDIVCHHVKVPCTIITAEMLERSDLCVEYAYVVAHTNLVPLKD